MKTAFTNREEVERKTLMILRIIQEAGQTVGSRLIARRMGELGVSSSERAVRYHLKLMDERGLTKLIGDRDGRVITSVGVTELGKARVHDKVGLAISRIEILAFQTTFDPETRRGLLPVNISLFPRKDFPDVIELMKPVFDAGYSVSSRVGLLTEGQRICGIIVPEGKIAMATVCSIVINGVLLKNGIPMDSKFGGLLEMKKRDPLRFSELIYYSGSSLDPSEVFIRGRMTSVKSAVKDGDGMILANFREIPAPCFSLVESIMAKLSVADINGLLIAGKVSEPVCQIPVDVNKVGVILLGGLNPAACVREASVDVDNRAMSAVMEYSELIPFSDIYEMHRQRRRKSHSQ
jgi:HTH-type transcriptional regulator, global nitrogen regulator NrpRI